MDTKSEKLIDLQSAPLRYKIMLTEGRINEAVVEFGVDNCYVSFSGGKDSTVLLHIARKLYPEMKAVFFDTGLEFPEIRDFVKSFDNVELIRPKKSFKKVIEDNGVPVISKNVAMSISRYRNARDIYEAPITECTDIALREKKRVQMTLRLEGGINPTSGLKQTTGVIPKKWHDLAKNGDFKISETCCGALKKQPAKTYHKENGGIPLIGIMASDSQNRRLDYYKNGCNAFGKKIPQSRPLMLWTEADIWEYILKNDVKYSSIYDKGYSRTGCVFCLFGIEKDRYRFVRLEETHPKLHKYCIEQLGYDKILKAIGVPSGKDDYSFMPKQMDLILTQGR